MSAADANARLLLAVATVIVASRALGWLASKVGQPRVLGEMVAGVALGPSLLGLVWPHAGHYLFPTAVLGGLRAIAQIGLILFMFLVGFEVDLEHIRGQGRRAVVISGFSVVVPFALGAALATWMHPRFAAGTAPVSFALFMGLAMAITAFPVLARVLQEAGIESSRLGALALTCAAVDDVTAWCGLAAVVAFVNATTQWDAVLALARTIAFVVAMLLVVRPLLKRWPSIPVPLVIAFALASAWMSEWIGIHAIFGAFLAGVVMPRSGPRRRDLADRVGLVATTVLLPIFFVVVGLSTKIGKLDSVYLVLVTLLIIAVAALGKLGGAAFAGRLVGEKWRDSLVIGILMNTRGLTEIVILTAGLELHVIDETVFTMMVVMAFVTTMMAGPILRALGVTRRPADRGATSTGQPA